MCIRDRGNTVVIMDREDYNNKIQNFIINNNIGLLNSDPTENYVKRLNRFNRCTHLFDEQTRSLKPINSKAPVLTGLPKLQKDAIPLRPLVNFTTAPGYKTAKKLVNIIKHNIQIINDHSLINSVDFVNKVKNLIVEPSYKLVSFDIVNLYTNIPVAETLRILKINLIDTNKLDIDSLNEMMHIL